MDFYDADVVCQGCGQRIAVTLNERRMDRAYSVEFSFSRYTLRLIRSEAYTCPRPWCGHDHRAGETVRLVNVRDVPPLVAERLERLERAAER